ncbi:MAG: hypothetical protein K0S37_1494 [Microbacterium sp.]|nr:hypothetical protein [Microbacterium sp.]
MVRATRVRAGTFVLIGYLALLLAAAGWTAFGGSVVLLLVSVLVPAVILLRGRMALSAALALLLVVAAWGTLVIFIVSRYTRVPPLVLLISAAVVSGAFCALRLRRTGVTFTRGDATDLAFVGLGGLAWCAVLTTAAVMPGGTPVSWAMSGDAANNILFARGMLEQGGVSVGGGQNPVPLTAAFIALFTLPAARFGTPEVGPALIALTEMWSFGIIAACVMCGALALELMRRRRALGLVGVAVSSLMPLGWFLLSGPLLLGFVNFHLTLALLVAGLVALLHANRAVLASLFTISLSLGAMLALWAPLAGIPGVALVVLLVAHRRRLLALRQWRLVLAVLALAQPAAFFASVSVPSILGQGAALQESLGAVFDFPRSLLVVVLVLAGVFGLAYLRTTRTSDIGWVLLSVIGGGGVCLAALLWLRRHEVDPWSYYQLKFLWFFMAILLIVGVAAGFAFASAIGARSGWAAISVVVVLATVVGVSEMGKATVPTFNRDAQALTDPIARILVGDFFSIGENDRVFDRVVELLDGQDQTILWESTDPDEDSIMFWVVQMSATSIDDVELRNYAYYHDGQSMDDLCSVRELIGAPVTVVTADPEIARRADEACADLGPVRLEQ